MKKVSITESLQSAASDGFAQQQMLLMCYHPLAMFNPMGMAVSASMLTMMVWTHAQQSPLGMQTYRDLVSIHSKKSPLAPFLRPT